MRDKLRVVRKVLRSKAFVYTDEKEALMLVAFGDISASLQLLALTSIRNNLNKVIKEMQTGLGFSEAVSKAEVTKETPNG